MDTGSKTGRSGDEDFSDQAPVSHSKATQRPAHHEATVAPRRTRSAEAVWGDEFGDSTSIHTLKQPGASRSSQLGSVLSDIATLPDLSNVGYDELRLLGEGGVGVVYEAVQKSVGRCIAVKMIKPGISGDADERRKFLAEAAVTGTLEHPNIVPIHDLQTTAKGDPFYTMKLVRGTPWSEAIGQKTVIENLRVLHAVCDAVSFAHSRRVVHRDLKPANTMLGEFGEVQLMDWGLAAPVSEAGVLVDCTGPAAAGGTPAYMAPEMVTGDDGPVGLHSDIYLLGAMLYEIVTGKPPHAGSRVLETLENAQSNVIQPTERSGTLVEIALRAMRTDPSERYASVSDFKRALLEYESHLESINLGARAKQDLAEACTSDDYERFAQAVYGFRQAVALWSDNREAQDGIVEVQLQYARSAFAKGDLDLAASNLDPNCSAHRDLHRDIEAARVRRQSARRRMRILRAVTIILTAAVMIILTVASIWISRAKRAAEDSMVKAQTEEARAVKALDDLEKAYSDLLTARELERKAREDELQAKTQAKASEAEATRARDELAKSGMLLDNSWWVFDAAAGRQRQEEAAGEVGMPVELAIPLATGVELAMVVIPPGEFVMGSPPDEANRAADEHLHRVRISRAFYLSTYETNEAQWQAVVGRPTNAKAERDPDPSLPVVGVSYARIEQDLLPALQQRAPKGYAFRLPTEAQWEFACRAGTATAYYTGSGSSALEAAGWFLSNSGRKVQAVGTKSPNAFGLHDMHGNVSEMCVDRFVPGFYLESPTVDPVAVSEGEIHVARGGSVLNIAEHCRSAYRSYVYKKNEYPFLGIRLALVPLGSTETRTTPSEP